MTNKYKPQISSVFKDLKNSGEAMDLLNEQEAILNTEWIEKNFVIASWGRIDWSQMPESICVRYKEDPELVKALEKIIIEQKLKGTLIVSWSNALTLPIRISIDVLRKYAADIFYEQLDTWICNEEDRWCIEHYHDGEICFGKCITTN